MSYVMSKLKLLTLELLNKYYDSEKTVIYEYSGQIQEDLKKLDKEYNETLLKIKTLIVNYKEES